MMSVEDILDTLQWVEHIGGLKELFNRSDKSLLYISEWIENNSSFEFMNSNKQTCSNTGITFQIKDNWFKSIEETKQKEIMNKIFLYYIKKKLHMISLAIQKHLLHLEYGVEEQWNLEMYKNYFLG